MSSKIEFSVVTPVYNRADTVGRCIESVISQLKHGIWLEHIIVDDGSTDGTDKIITLYAKRQPHINSIRFDQNRGVNAARNEAISHATGEFILLLDSDDYFCPEAIHTIITEITAHPGYLHYLFVPDDRVDYIAKNILLAGKTHCEIKYSDMLTDRVGGDFIHVVNRKIMSIFPFEEELRIYEGLTFLQFYRKEQVLFFSNNIVAIRERGRKDSVSKEYLHIKKDALLKNILYLEKVLQLFGEDLQKWGAQTKLRTIRRKLFLNYCFLGGGGSYRQRAEKILKAHELSLVYKIIYYLRFGGIIRYFLSSYLYTKYYFINKKLE